MRGRPLGFLGIVTAGWVAARAFMLWPVAGSASAIATIPSLLPELRTMAFGRTPVTPLPFAGASIDPLAGLPVRPAVATHASTMTDAEIVALFGLPYYTEVRPVPALIPAAFSLTPSAPVVAPGDPVGAAVASAAPASSRWTVAGWLIARPGQSNGRLGPQLGASQAGVRVSYALDDDRRVAVFARAATPLAQGARELAAGLQWRPTAAPVTGFVEARKLSGLPVAPAIGVFGGAEAALPGRFRLEAYGQAGWVGGRAATGFADGQLRIDRVILTDDTARLAVGGGVWGAAQRGASRLDAGPGLGIALPVGRGIARVTLDWRQRIAGNARPGSGAVVTLGAGF